MNLLAKHHALAGRLRINPDPLKVVCVPVCRGCGRRAPWCSCGAMAYETSLQGTHPGTDLRHAGARVNLLAKHRLLAEGFESFRNSEGTHPGTDLRHAASDGQSRRPGSSGQGGHGPNVARRSVEASPATRKDGEQGERRNRGTAPLAVADTDYAKGDLS